MFIHHTTNYLGFLTYLIRVQSTYVYIHWIIILTTIKHSISNTPPPYLLQCIYWTWQYICIDDQTSRPNSHTHTHTHQWPNAKLRIGCRPTWIKVLQTAKRGHCATHIIAMFHSSAGSFTKSLSLLYSVMPKMWSTCIWMNDLKELWRDSEAGTAANNKKKKGKKKNIRTPNEHSIAHCMHSWFITIIKS